MPSPVTIPAISQTWTPANVPTDAYVELGSASQPPGLGSAKMLLSQIGSTINVKNYGAVGDGTTNDTAAIAAAFTAAADGATVYFPAGTYAITTITLHKGLHLVGDGPYASTIKRIASGVGVASNLLFFEANGGVPISAVSLEGLGFDHAWNGSLVSVYSCVTIYEANAVTIRNCFFTRGQYHGVKLNGCYDTNVTGNRFYQCKYDGIGVGGPGGLPLLRRAKDVRIIGNAFEDVFGGVIVQVGVDRVQVAHNSFKKSNLQFGQDCTAVVIEGNSLEGRNTYGDTTVAASGIYVEGNTDVLVSNNTVKGFNSGPGAHYGIWIDGSELTVGMVTTQLPSLNTIVRGNMIYDCTNAGIIVTGASEDGSLQGLNITVQGNHMFECGDGISFNSVTGGAVQGNFVYTPQFTGIVISGTLNTMVVGNQVYNPSESASNSYWGIQITGGALHTWVIGNVLVDNRGFGSEKMRFGVFDAVLNGGTQSYVRSRENVISGAVTGISWFPAPAAPTTGTWDRGDAVQSFATPEGGPNFWECIVGGTSGVWRGAGGQNGYKETNATPIASITPTFIGELLFDSITKTWWISVGATNLDWKQLTP